jgi:hypothetical protein
MNITFEELRDIKHKLPSGSIKLIAEKLKIDEQTVRNYFGASNYEDGKAAGIHIEPGPHGGIVHIEDTAILDLAMEIIENSTGSEASDN